MTKLRRFLTGLLLVPLIWHSAAGQSLDPAFSPSTIYAPGTVYSVVEQPDGKRVATGNFRRINHTDALSICRLAPDGTLDAAFQQNIGAASANLFRLRRLDNGQFLVNSFSTSPLTVGGITRPGLLRLNADGTGDASFNPGSGPAMNTRVGYVDDFLALANGQTIATGYFTSFNGVTAGNIVRLSATGAVDPSFNAGVGANDDISAIAALPNGQYLIGGFLNRYNGTPCNGLARLNADGSLDPTFIQGLTAGSYVYNITVQPDGKILLTGSLRNVSSSTYVTMVRLLATGAIDPSFTLPAGQGSTIGLSTFSGKSIALQPDGKIIVGYANAANKPSLVRLNVDGSLDPSFQTGSSPNTYPNDLTLLGNGNLLVAGDLTSFNGTAATQTLVELTGSGSLNPTFQPLIQASGVVNALVRQANGKLVVGGNFSEINGQAVSYLARFNADGTRDTSFPPVSGITAPVVDLVQQADERLIVATAETVRRLQATGSPDNTFNAPDFSGSTISQLLLQPNGRLLVGGAFYSPNTIVRRLLPDGSVDATFTLNASPGDVDSFAGMALQSDGKLLVGCYYYSSTGNSRYTVLRFQTNGVVDVNFTSSAISGMARRIITQPDDKILVGGSFTQYAGTARSNLARLNATGTLDTGFTPPTTTGTISTLLLQPNNRLLVGGSFTSPTLPTNLARLLSNGQADASFGATAVPNAQVNSLLIQPDGNLVVGGAFTSVSGQPSMALARLTGANVLHVAAPQAVADHTAAWPVPARTSLHVAPDATAHPQLLDLLDVLGRPVLHQALSPGAEATLAVGQLPAGTYLLRVTYAEGVVVRRIQVQ